MGKKANGFSKGAKGRLAMNSKKKSMSQGARANVNGKIAEKMLIPLFEENDYMVISYGEYSKSQKSLKKCVMGSINRGTPSKISTNWINLS